MTIVELIALVALVGYAIYRQTRTNEITGHDRFRLAAIYVIVGVCLGIHFPHSPEALGLIGVSILAGVVVGLLRGRYTRMWQENGRVFTRGTPLTIGLFLALIAFKFGLGTVAYLTHTSYEGSVGEVLVVVGVMLAVQAQLIWNRAQRQFSGTERNQLVGAGR
jgi:uncharacterized membrane protein YidH (DUF202 family)